MSFFKGGGSSGPLAKLFTKIGAPPSAIKAFTGQRGTAPVVGQARRRLLKRRRGGSVGSRLRRGATPRTLLGEPERRKEKLGE